MGLVILAFFLNGKKVSCDYGPEARVKKNIISKTLLFSDDFRSEIQNQDIDSLTIQQVLIKGDVNFSKSNTRQEPCGLYAIEGEIQEKELVLTVENCDSIATIKSMVWK